MRIHDMDIDGLPECYDVQLMYDDQVTQDGRSSALSYAMWKFDKRSVRTHGVLSDALNTVEIMK